MHLSAGERGFVESGRVTLDRIGLDQGRAEEGKRCMESGDCKLSAVMVSSEDSPHYLDKIGS